MELNWKEDNNLVRKIAKILLGDTLPNGEPVSSLVLIDAASRAELQRWADMSDAEFEAARLSGDTIHIDVDDEIKHITEEYGLDPNFLDDLITESDEDADDDMEIFLDAENEIDQELLAEIEEWEQQEQCLQRAGSSLRQQGQLLALVEQEMSVEPEQIWDRRME